MQHAALAERFDDAGRQLEASGHRIIVRKARALVEAGDLDGAVAFLEEAGKRQRSDSIDALAEALTEWAVGDGDVDALKAESSWSRARDREDRAATLIAEATAGGDLAGLTASLARQQAALAAHEPIDLGPVAAPTVDAPVDEPVEAPVDAPAAAVEKPVDLEAREPDFDEPTADEPVDEPIVDTPARSPGLSLDKPVSAPVDEPVADEPMDEPVVDEPVDEPSTPADFGTPDTAADVSPPERPGTDAASEGTAWGPILIAVGVAAAVAAYFLL